MRKGQKTKGTPSDNTKVTTPMIRDTFATKPGTAFELFHTHDREPYITFPIGDHIETRPIKSSEFRYALGSLLYKQGVVVDDKLLDEYCAQAISEALYGGKPSSG